MFVESQFLIEGALSLRAVDIFYCCLVPKSGGEGYILARVVGFAVVDVEELLKLFWVDVYVLPAEYSDSFVLLEQSGQSFTVLWSVGFWSCLS